MRTFHPIDALSGYDYGNIIHYYRWDGTYSTGTPPTKSAVLLEVASLSEEKVSVLDNLVAGTSVHDKSEFEKLYQLWKNTWESPELMIQSNPREFTKSDHYVALLNFCKNKGKEILPLVFDKYITGDELSMLLVADLTKDEYSWLMKEIKQQGRMKSTKVNVIPSQKANYTNYIAALLGDLQKNMQLTNTSLISNNSFCKIYPIPANNLLKLDISVLYPGEVKISIYDVSGKLIKLVSKYITSGNHTININLDKIGSGLYFCEVLTVGNTYSTKIQIQK